MSKVGDAWNMQLRMSKFWAKVDKNAPGGCWIWLGRSEHGYGYCDTGFNIAGERRVHRFVWTLEHGPIEAGVDLHHEVCENGLCCNPDHLVPMAHEIHAALSSAKNKGKNYGGWGSGTPHLKRQSLKGVTE